VQLTGRNDNSLALTILGYQFPDSDDYFDANWLVVRADVRNDDGSWSATSPCLLTSNVAELASWLEAPVGELEFMEPNLAFECLALDDDTADLRVWFELEFRPEWAENRVAGQRDLSANLTVSRAELADAAAGLRRQLAAYPPRGERS